MYRKCCDLPLRMSFFGFCEVGRPYNGLPAGHGVVTSQRQGNNGSGAHEGRQAGENEVSVLVCVELTTLLWTQLQHPPLPHK